ncbi:MAG: ABC transporter substrate-binding protein [Phycisphaeraceae bacterium]|nr:ABC transporter substrate-binding protein [Phycisphaeraceae bacterium]
MRFACVLLALLLVLTEFAACDRKTPAASTSVTPTAGGTSAQSTELRIVALSPALAIILKDLGYEGQIVGRHAYDVALDPAIPACGELGTIDYESLVKARPTHIFIQWGAQELPARLTELASANNWVIKDLNPLTLDEIELAAREMDQTIFDFATRGLKGKVPDAPAGQPEHIKPAMPFEDSMHMAWSDRGPLMKAAGRILLVSGTKPIGALGPGSFHFQLLQRLGATPVPSSGGPWITLDMEDLHKLAPDGIILFSPRPPRSEPTAAPKPEELIALFGRGGELPIPAFKNKRVALIDDPYCLTPSTAMIKVADEVAEIVSGWGEAATETGQSSGN